MSSPPFSAEEHAWILESLERVDRVLLRRDERQRALDELLELLLEVFDCHRAWLAPTPSEGVKRIHYERTVPDFVSAEGLPSGAGTRTAALRARAGEAVAAGEGNELPLPPADARREGCEIHTQLAMALQPVDEAGWIVGLDHCTAPRVWTTAERWLFEATGRRVSDALERIRVAEEVRDLSSVVTAMVDPLLITDLGGQIRYVNRALTESTGRPADQLVGRSIYELIVADRDQIWHEGIALEPEGLLPASGEYLARHADGTEEPYSVHFSLLRDEAGQPREVIASARNISAERLAEQERSQLAEQLRQSQKMEAIGRLAGGIAHDFNNLITAIIGYAEMGLVDLPPEHPLHPDLGEIMGAAERAATLTSQLLAFSRKQLVSPQVVDLNRVIGDSKRMFQRLIGEDITLRFEPAEGLWPVRCDVNQIDQVLINLAINARDAMPSGGALTIRTENVVLDEEALRGEQEGEPGEHVLITVTDTGTGIDAETCPRIFEPFFSTKPKDIGTGLGLSTVYGIVKQNHGMIEVTSELGEGTCFRIHLPRVEARERVGPRRKAGEKPPRGAETILLVEDEGSVRRLAHRILQSLGYQVLEASDGPSALELVAAESSPIDLLLTDVIMPDLNGRQLCEQLRETTPGLKVLFMSGYAEEVVAVHGVLDPGIVFVPKPFSLLTLARKVREALDAEPGTPTEGRSTSGTSTDGAS